MLGGKGGNNAMSSLYIEKKGGGGGGGEGGEGRGREEGRGVSCCWLCWLLLVLFVC